MTRIILDKIAIDGKFPASTIAPQVLSILKSNDKQTNQNDRKVEDRTCKGCRMCGLNLMESLPAVKIHRHRAPLGSKRRRRTSYPAWSPRWTISFRFKREHNLMFKESGRTSTLLEVS